MIALMYGENISPAEKFHALCGKGTWVFHTIHARRKNLFVRTKNLFAQGKNLFARRKNLFARVKNLFAQGKNLFARTKNLFAQGKNLFARVKNLFAQGKNLFARTKNLSTRPKNLFARTKNLCAIRINPRKALIYQDAAHGNPNEPISGLRIPWTNKAGGYSHVSTADLNKAWLMIVKVLVNSCKPAAKINH